ncbi:MAG: lipopolysaccharide biosynthesis protein [Nitrospirae bacterium]|nr:lipopolysaccharide biosynthesis protein [Candidatus Manganitrophaceae bacterium]
MSVDKKTNHPPSDQLARSVKKGAVWTFLGRALVFLINIGGSIVMARLLEPEDFGVFGIALLFVGLATRFGNVGFGLALVQREHIEDEHVSSLFVVNLCLFSTIAVLLIWGSPWIGRSFDSPIAGEVLSVLAFLFFLKPFSSVARALLQRKMAFKSTAIAGSLQHFLGVLSAISLAWYGFGVWSLVYAELVGASVSLAVLMIYAKWRPHFSYHHKAMKDLYAFGIAIFFKRILTYGADKADFFIIANRLGATPLGFYEKSYSLMNMTIKELGDKMEPVLFRAFSKIQNDRGRILAAYNKVLLTFSLISYPIFFGLASVAPPFIFLLYGEKWMPSVIPLQIMCLSGLLRLHLKVTSIVMNAMGKVKVEAWIRTVAFALLIVACWIGSQWGIIGVATAATIVSGILSVATTLYFGRLTQLTYLALMRPQTSPFIASIFMYGMVLLFQKWFSGAGEAHSFPVLFLSIAVGIITYISAFFVLRPAPVLALMKEFLVDLKPLFKKFKRSS